MAIDLNKSHYNSEGQKMRVVYPERDVPEIYPQRKVSLEKEVPEVYPRRMTFPERYSPEIYPRRERYPAAGNVFADEKKDVFPEIKAREESLPVPAEKGKTDITVLSHMRGRVSFKNIKDRLTPLFLFNLCAALFFLWVTVYAVFASL